MTKRAPAVVAVLLLLVAMISVQFGASFAKTLFPVAGPAGTVALRLTFSTVILWAVMRPWRRWPDRAAWRPLATYGAVLGVMNLCFYNALKSLPLGIAVAIEFTGPLAVALLASRRALDFVWIALAAGGLLGLLPIAGAKIDLVGVGFALAAALCWALYIWFGKQAATAYGPAAVAVGSLLATILVAPIGFVQAGAVLLAPHVLLIGLTVAVLSSAIPYGLEIVALTRLPTKTFGTLMSLEPALGALAGLAILGEQLSLRSWASIAAIMLASAGATISARREAAPPVVD